MSTVHSVMRRGRGDLSLEVFSPTPDRPLSIHSIKVNYLLCQGMGSDKGRRREGLYDVLLRQFISKYTGVAVLVQPFLIQRKPGI